MQPNEIKALLDAGLENCDVRVEGEGSHFDILVIGEVFAGMRPVQKQQLVYGVLQEQIASGSIHAVNIRTFTASEWDAQAN
jgi:acid stress-induced BolA-like protein IbaG/YrbA